MITLSNETKKKFEEDAYVVLRENLFENEDFERLKKYIMAFCQAIPEEIRHKNFANAPKLIPKIGDLISAPPVVNLVEQILGPDIVSWSFGICYKPANSPYRVPAHADSHFWLDWNLLEPNEVLGLFIPLTDLTVENGCLNVLPGVNQPKLYKHKSVDPNTNFFFKEIDDPEIDLSKLKPIEMKANQVCLIKENLIHSSEPNRSDKPRAAITLRYISGKTKYNPHPSDVHRMYLIKGKNIAGNPQVKDISTAESYGGYSWSR